MTTNRSVQQKTPAAKVEQPTPETLPLSAVSITVKRPALFTDDETTVTFDGKALGDVLRWVATACPNVSRFCEPGSVALEIAGMAEQCRAISDARLDHLTADHSALWGSVADRLRDLASRITSGQFADGVPEITVTRKKPAEEEVAPKARVGGAA